MSALAILLIIGSLAFLGYEVFKLVTDLKKNRVHKEDNDKNK